MKDEIKEILDRLERIDHKEYSSGFEFADSGSFDEDCRCFEERKKLANYITNLQEENKMYSQLKDEYEDIIEKAIEYINKLSNEPNVFGHYGIDYNCKKHLLNILQGVDNNEN